MKSCYKTVLEGLLCICLISQAFALSNKNPDLPLQSSPLIPHTLIQEAGWDYNWQINLPLKDGEEIDRINVFGKYLYVLSTSNMLFCIDQQTGKTRSLLQIGSKGLPVSRATFYEGRIGIIVGNEVQVFDPISGTISFKKQFPQIGTSKGALSRNSKYLYIAGSDNRLHAINVDGFWQQFEASADNDSRIVSIIATDDLIVFATEMGNVVGMAPDSPKKIWQFDATGKFQGELKLDDGAVYFGSEDSKFYKLDPNNGTLMWDDPFHSGGPIRDSLTIGVKVAYVYNHLSGLYGVDKQTGKPVWNADSGKAMICETGEKAFIYADAGVLKVMDNNTGKEIYSINLANVTHYAQNTLSPVMFLSDNTGRIMSISVN